MTPTSALPAIASFQGRCLLLGADGLVGAALGQWLIARGWQVTALGPQRPQRLQATAAAADLSHQLAWDCSDLGDTDAVGAALAQHHVVVLLGVAATGHTAAAPALALGGQLQQRAGLLQACAAAQVPVLLGSSAAVYGAAVCDLAEDTAAVFSDIGLARWAVGLAEACSEQLASSLAVSAGLRHCTARLMDVYGSPGESRSAATEVMSLLNSLQHGLALAVGDGAEVVRSPCHVDDAAEAAGLLVESLVGRGPASLETILGQTVVIGRSAPVTIAQVASLLQRLSSAPVALDDQRRLDGARYVPRQVPNASRAEALLGWQARTDLAQGLSRILAELGLLAPPPHLDWEPVRVPFVMPDLHLNSELLQTLGLVLAGGHVTNHGPQAQALEAELGQWFDQPAVVCGSATGGLTAALLALERTGCAILPSFTYLATLNAVRSAGLTPVFCDIDPDTWTMSPHHLRLLLEQVPDVAAVVPVTVFGVVAELASLAALTRPRGIALVLDDAHGWGSTSDSYSLADIRVLSMHATKNLAAVEGGVVLAGDAKLLQSTRLRIHHGLDQTQPLRSVHGGNFKLSELHAAVARRGLQHLPQDLAARRGHAQRLAALVDRCPGLERQRQSPHGTSGWQNLGVRLELAAGASMDKAVADLGHRGVLARRYFWPPLHLLPGSATAALPVTDDLARRQLCLPLAHRMEPAQLLAIEAVLPGWAERWAAPEPDNLKNQEHL